ncbi:hypothetical protein BY458DRAFT_504770 [Sporodiniella umbellata]|nr:hypothetical protein BY458DRAFT_504770 [Sporodiniella umbellata]
MSGKKKAQKMSLSDFLANDNSAAGSWADDVSDLPTAPAARGGGMDRSDNRFDSRGQDEDRGFQRRHHDREDRGFGGSRGGFESRERSFTPRAPVDFPTQPPYTAHIASLSFDANEDDLAQLFDGLKIANIRLLRDRQTERSKGFAYVEFEDVESLKSAIDLSGESIHGRGIRISVAEPPRDNERVRQPDRTDVDTWRRKGPIDLPEPSRREFGGRGGFGGERSGFGGGRGGFRNDRHGQQDRPSERPRLNLKPRTVDTHSDSPSTSTPKANKPDPFGGARPVDTDKVMKDLEKKIEDTSIHH